MLIYTVQLNQHCTVCTEVCIERPLFLFLRISQNCLLNDLSEQLLGLSPTFLFNYITFILSLRQTQCLSFLTGCLSGAYFQDRAFSDTDEFCRRDFYYRKLLQHKSL